MKKIIGVILCLVLTLSLAACNIQPRMGSGDLVIARSGEHEVLLRDFLYYLGNMRADTEDMLNEMMGMMFGEFEEYWEMETFDGSGITIFESMKESALENAKWAAALYILAQERGYTYDPSEIELLRENVQEYVMFLSHNTPNRIGEGERLFYEMHYVTSTEIVDMFRMLSTNDAFQISLHGGIMVTEADMRDFYNDPDNSDLVQSLRGITVAHILISIDFEADDVEAEIEEAEALAEELLARIEAGESFAELVIQYSQDPGSVGTEGQYYISMNAPFVPEFMMWTFEAEEGDFGIVESQFGFHIMNLVRRDGFEELLETRFLPAESEPGQPPATLPALEDVVRHTLFVAEIERLLDGLQLDWAVYEELFNSVQYDVYARQGR